MNNNDEYYPLKVFFDVMYFLGHVLIWGGFLLIVIIAVKTNGFPEGLIEGLIFGSLIAALSWFKNFKSHRDAVDAGRKLRSYFHGDTEVLQSSKHYGYIILGIVLIGLATLIMNIFR